MSHLNIKEQLRWLEAGNTLFSWWRLKTALHLLFCRNCREALADTRANADIIKTVNACYKERETIETEIKTLESK